MNLEEERLNIQIDQLLNQIKNSDKIDSQSVIDAIEFGKLAHEGQFRKTGDLFFIHPVRVAKRAVEYNLDSETVIASLLHDVIEDTDIEVEKVRLSTEIRGVFGKTVSDLVNALTKVKENQNLTLYKIFQLGNFDFRVILIKLLDRLDNLSDLNYLTRKKQRRICQETIAIYAEVAHGLGLIEIEEKLKDLVFRVLYPASYKRISKNLEGFYQERQVAIQIIVEEIKKHTPSEQVISIAPQYINAQEFVFNRQEIVKILNSIIIKVTNPLSCYSTLGHIHTTFRSVPLNIYDYISNPKANGWRGLSTKVIINGEQIRIYIVTQEFHEKNRRGVLTLLNEEIYRSKDYRDFLELYSEVASEKDIRIDDVFRHNKSKTIQTMTPAGDIIELRYGATILDFAFMIHTELALKSTGGIIDNVRYPRNKILEDGMVIKVIKSDSILTEKAWIRDVVMPKSRKEILKYLNFRKKSALPQS